MNDFQETRLRPLQLERYAWSLALVWAMVVATSLVWNLAEVRHNTLEVARIQARIAHQKDIIYRRWNSGHGGVYVPVTEATDPNPYLSNMPERDITTPSGKPLTLMNPAYMTRQVHELAEKEYGVLAHITSLNPIRQANAPDPWETEALRSFERGESETSSVEEMEGEEYMRLMRPLITEHGCLKCHAVQGYQEGDVRGGISVSIPMQPLWAVAHTQVLPLAGGHTVLWLMGLGGIAWVTRRLRRGDRARSLTIEALEERTRQLEASRTQLHRAQRLASVGTLAAGIAHEINNPLGLILLSAQRALETSGDPKAVETSLHRIKDDVKRCERIVKSVLQFSQEQSSNKWPVDVNQCVRRSEEFTREYASRHGVQLLFERARDLPAVVANPTELEQAFVNLTHNAVEACGDGQTVTLRTERSPTGVRFTVADQGRGMTVEDREHAFDPFYTTRQQRGGTGLGLSIVHGIIIDQGGTIEIDSQPGKGTRVIIELPVEVRENSKD